MIERLCICGQEMYGKPLVTSTQFCCELKSDPKNKVYLKKKRKIIMAAVWKIKQSPMNAEVDKSVKKLLLV